MSHDRHHGLGHRHGPKEVRLKLQTQLFEPDILRESSYGKPGIIHQHVNSPIILHHRLHESGQKVEAGHVQRTHVNEASDARILRHAIQLLAPPHIAHACDHVEAGLRQLHTSQQSEAAR